MTVSLTYAGFLAGGNAGECRAIRGGEERRSQLPIHVMVRM